MPRKNVRLVAGEPLIAYAIRAARESNLLTSFLTSTDDDEIAEVAIAHGSAILWRPPGLAQDDTPMVPVLLHALEFAEKAAGTAFDAIVVLQPTSPIRTGADLDAIISMLNEDRSVDTVISVCPMDDTHPARMYRTDADGRMDPLWPEWETARRQDLPAVFHRNGALYGVRRRGLVENRTVMGGVKKAYVMPRERLANVDDERDLLIADLLVREWKEGRL